MVNEIKNLVGLNVILHGVKIGQQGPSWLSVSKMIKVLQSSDISKIPQHCNTFPPTFPPIHTNYIIYMCQDLKTFKPHDL
jgi:hypothetical protein